MEFFIERVETLMRLEAVRQGVGYNYTLNGSRLAGVHENLEEPSDRDLRSILGELRKFVAQDSDANLNRVHGIVYRSLRPTDARTAEYKSALAQMNKRWKDAFGNGFARVTINGTRVSPEHAWDAWINGHYLHDDVDYREELKRLDVAFKDMHRVQFMEGVVVTLKYTNWLGLNNIRIGWDSMLSTSYSMTCWTCQLPRGATG